MHIGVNTFGLRGPFYRDRDNALERLKACGVSSLEVCVAFPSEERPRKRTAPQDENFDYVEARAAIWGNEDAPEKIEEIRRCGLEVFSAHVMFEADTPEDMLIQLPRLRAFSEATGIRCIVFSPSKQSDDLVALIPGFDAVSSALAKDDILFLIHNHEQECMLKGGITGLELVLAQCPALGLELDVGWAEFAGRDSLELMDKLKAQLAMLHLKDIRSDASPETRNRCCTAIGEGSIPLVQIMDKARQLGLGDRRIIIDQDDSPSDILSDIARGMQNIQRLVV